MKAYKKLKGLGKGLKFGLAGAVLYAATLAMPVHAEVKQGQAVPQVKLEQITTVEQADSLYKEKLKEYSTDKLLEFGEFESLCKVQVVRKDLLEKQKEHLMKNYDDGEIGKVKRLDAEIKEYEKRLANKEKIETLAKTREKLDEKILGYYPSLVGKDKGNVVNSAGDMLEPELNAAFKGVVVEADKILKQCCKDNRLELLVKKDKFDLNNVLALYNMIKDKDDHFDKDKKIELKKKIDSLKERKSQMVNLRQYLALKNKLNHFDEEIGKSSKFIGWYERYLDQKEKVKKFEANYGNFNNECSIGIIKDYILEKKGLKGDNSLSLVRKRFERENESVISGLEDYFGDGLGVEGLGNPARTRLPFWLGTLVLGLGFPIVRNLLVKGYVKGSDADEDEYAASVMAGLGNGLLGVLVIDGLHPLVYPARMLSPLVLQPIFKILKVDPCKWVAENF